MVVNDGLWKFSIYLIMDSSDSMHFLQRAIIVDCGGSILEFGWTFPKFNEPQTPTDL